MKSVVFMCVENSCRSQMAEGFAREFGAGVIEPYSAGSEPSGKVNPRAIEAMKEIGIDISSHRSKSLQDLGLETVDYSVTMGCGDVCPIIPSHEKIDWKIEDPKNGDAEFFGKVRNIIRDNVKGLIEEIRKK